MITDNKTTFCTSCGEKTQRNRNHICKNTNLWPNPITTPLLLIESFIENAEINIYQPDKKWSPIVAQELKRLRNLMIELDIGDK